MFEVIDATSPDQAAALLAAPALRQGFKPEALHTYKDEDGTPIYWRIRLKHPDGRKWIRPLKQDGKGKFTLGEPPAPPAGKPLYLLPDIARNPGAEVIVCEGEKAADALVTRGCIATTSGSADSAATAEWAPLQGRRVLIWPDFDAAGQRYAQAVVEALRGVAAEVRIIDVEKLDLRDKGDAWDWCAARPDATAADVLALSVIETEKSALGGQFLAAEFEPLPLRDALRRAEGLLQADVDGANEPYPLDDLGPLSEAAQDIAEGAQVDPAMAGQSILAAAAVLAQRVANVRTADGAAKPLSLFCMTVAQSGDGKDTADRPALRVIHEYQREAGELYRAELARYEAKPRKRGEHKAEPRGPAPYILVADLTIEGLRRSLAEGIAAQGVFSTEAAAVLAGHAMSAEHRLKTAANLCGLWDRGHLSVVRAAEGRTERYGVRLSAHLLIQPSAVAETLTDEALANIGLWPRFLLAWPPALAPRRHLPWRADESPALRRFWGDCTRLLSHPCPHDCDSLPVLELGPDALPDVAAFFERMEHEARRGALRDVRPFALRATEQLLRIAGVLTVWAGGKAIDKDAAAHAARLLSYSLSQWQQALAGRADPAAIWALTLYRWLAERSEPVAIRDMTKLAPTIIRPSARRDVALDRLLAVGLVGIKDGQVSALGVAP